MKKKKLFLLLISTTFIVILYISFSQIFPNSNHHQNEIEYQLIKTSTTGYRSTSYDTGTSSVFIPINLAPSDNVIWIDKKD